MLFMMCGSRITLHVCEIIHQYLSDIERFYHRFFYSILLTWDRKKQQHDRIL